MAVWEGHHRPDSFEPDMHRTLTLRDARFQAFRTQELTRLLGIPEDIRSIALAARCLLRGPLLNAATLNRIWKDAEGYRQVARDNPQLLRLVLAQQRDRRYGRRPPGVDPVKRLNDALAANGLSVAAWRSAATAANCVRSQSRTTTASDGHRN